MELMIVTKCLTLPIRRNDMDPSKAASRNIKRLTVSLPSLSTLPSERVLGVCYLVLLLSMMLGVHAVLYN